MRERLHDAVAALESRLADMCGLVADAMQNATRALLTGDAEVADQVVAGDAEIDARRADCEHDAQALIALHAPVARELRVVLGVIHCADRVERMGDLARHVAETVRRDHPSRAVPDPLRDTFADLGRWGVDAAHTLQRAIAAPNDTLAAEIAQFDDRVDAAHRQLLDTLRDPDWPHGVRAAVDAALLSRFYERFTDQALAIARHQHYVATGTMPVNNRIDRTPA